MDELFVHPQKLLHLYLRRRILGRVGRTFGASSLVCHQRLLVGSRRALGWTVLGTVFTMIALGFAGAARWGAFLPHYRHRPSAMAGSPAMWRDRVRRLQV